MAHSHGGNGSGGGGCACHLHKLPMEQTAEQFDFYTGLHGLVYRNAPIGQIHQRILGGASSSRQQGSSSGGGHTSVESWRRTFVAVYGEWYRRTVVSGRQRRQQQQRNTKEIAKSEGEGEGSLVNTAPTAVSAPSSLTRPQQYDMLQRFFNRAAAVAATSSSSISSSSSSPLEVVEHIASRVERGLRLLTEHNGFQKLRESSSPSSSSVSADADPTHAAAEGLLDAAEAMLLWGSLPRGVVCAWYEHHHSHRYSAQQEQEQQPLVSSATTSASLSSATTSASSSSELFFFWCLWQRSGAASDASPLLSRRARGRLAAYGYPTGDEEAEEQTGTQTEEGHHHDGSVGSSNSTAFSSSPSPTSDLILLDLLRERALILLFDVALDPMPSSSSSSSPSPSLPSPADLSQLCAFIARYCVLNGRDSSGYTPLHYAARGQGGVMMPSAAPVASLNNLSNGNTTNGDDDLSHLPQLLSSLLPSDGSSSSSGMDQSSAAVVTLLLPSMPLAKQKRIGIAPSSSSSLLSVGVSTVSATGAAEDQQQQQSLQNLQNGLDVAAQLMLKTLATVAEGSSLSPFSPSAIDFYSPSREAVLSGGATNLFAVTPSGHQSCLQRAASQGRLVVVCYILSVLQMVAGREVLGLLPGGGGGGGGGTATPAIGAGSSPSSSSSSASRHRYRHVFKLLCRALVLGGDSSGRSALSLAREECPQEAGVRSAMVAVLEAFSA